MEGSKLRSNGLLADCLPALSACVSIASAVLCGLMLTHIYMSHTLGWNECVPGATIRYSLQQRTLSASKRVRLRCSLLRLAVQPSPVAALLVRKADGSLVMSLSGNAFVSEAWLKKLCEASKRQKGSLRKQVTQRRSLCVSRRRLLVANV